MEPAFDAIVAGARCAGSPLATLLSRKGYRVLVVDRLAATGCPPMDTYSYDFGPVTISGAPGTADAPLAYCPRRTVLDKLLVDAAVDAGAEIREQFTVEDVVMEGERVTPEMQQLFGAIRGSQQAMDGFAQTNAGTISPRQFFSPENIGALMASA